MNGGRKRGARVSEEKRAGARRAMRRAAEAQRCAGHAHLHGVFAHPGARSEAALFERVLTQAGGEARFRRRRHRRRVRRARARVRRHHGVVVRMLEHGVHREVLDRVALTAALHSIATVETIRYDVLYARGGREKG